MSEEIDKSKIALGDYGKTKLNQLESKDQKKILEIKEYLNNALDEKDFVELTGLGVNEPVLEDVNKSIDTKKLDEIRARIYDYWRDDKPLNKKK